ncbi:MAG: GNAT family N-acetyltransferase [Pseudomonadota bacterium]
MKCTIQWNALTLDQWQERFSQIHRSNILQAYHYAQAIRPVKGQTAKWGLISMDGVEAGLVQISEAKTLFGLLHAVILDRGPLWFEGFGSAVHIKLFFDEMNSLYPLRFGRKRRVIPEIEQGAAIEQIIRQCGFEKTSHPSYQTLWWDLTIDDDEARKNLKKNWLSSLKKVEKSNAKIEWDCEGNFYEELKNYYILDKVDKGYEGISPKLLDNLALFSTQENPMVIGRVKVNSETVAGVLFLIHGRSATYQIGWSSSKGRQICAHHHLLWRARAELRRYNIEQVDLGGINNAAKGLSQFKQGTGAEPITLAGHYS